MEKINFIKTFIPQGDFREKYEHGGMMVRHLAAVLDEKMGAYECYECTVTIGEYDEGEIQKAFVEFSARMDALKLKQAKADKIADIASYDTSDKVNGFMLNGLLVWLDKATRVGLMNSTTIAKAAGQQTTTLWLGGLKLVVDCDKAIQLLSALEMYALECFNVTSAHKASVAELKTIKEVEAFDVTADYPQQLVMKL